MNLKVLKITNSFPNDWDKTRGVFFKELSLALNSSDKIDLSVLSSDFYSLKNVPPKKYLKLNKYDHQGIGVFQKGSLNFTGRIDLYPKYKVIKNIEKLYLEYIKLNKKPDILHAHVGLWAGWACMHLSKKYHIPYIVTEHATKVANRLYNTSQKKLLSEIYNNASKVTAVSEDLAEVIKQDYHLDSVEVVYNVVDTEKFKPDDTLTKEKKILSIGYLIDRKRFDLLIRAVKEVFNEYPEYKLDIIGVGNKRDELEKLSKDLGVFEKVNFLGAVEHSEIVNEYNKSEIFALCSDKETFGVVFIEAMSCGVPVLATKSGGPDRFINQMCGQLVEKGSKDGIVDALKLMIKNRSEYKAEEIRNYVINNFSNQVICDKYLHLYESITSQPNKK